MKSFFSNSAYHGFWGEHIATEIFKSVGYKIVFFPGSEELIPCDFLVEKNGTTYAVGVKATKEINAYRPSILSAADNLSMSAIAPLKASAPIIVALNVVSKSLRDQLSAQYPEVIVIDISNLLYMVQGNEELRNKLVSQLYFSVDGIDAVEPPIDLSIIPSTKSIWDEHIQILNRWNPKKRTSREYEKTCIKILHDLFADDLTLWRDQETSDDGLFRFDLICKIKKDNDKDFWEMAEKYFRSKYIVFEFKNYSGKVTQKEIFTTVKYLYVKALRGVAILISVNGCDDHSEKAIRGILREEGKLIISLSNADLIAMLEQKRDKKDPAEYLSGQLDELLIDLEK